MPQAVAELRTKCTTAVANASIVKGLLATPEWDWAQGTRNAKERDLKRALWMCVLSEKERQRQRERERERERDREKDRQTDRPCHNETERERDRESQIESERERERDQ